MSYAKRIVCLANSYKPPRGLCFAGRELLENGGYGSWIRPVSARPTEEVSYSECRYENYSSPKLLDIIDVPLLKPVPHNHQTENHLLDPTRRWVKQGEFSWQKLEDLREEPSSIWVNSGSTSQGMNDFMSQAEAAQVGSSLLLIRNAALAVESGTNPFSGKKMHRGDFNYHNSHYNFSVTDPRVRDAFAQEGSYEVKNAYLCLSLTEPWEKDGHCYKLVAAILTNPPL